MLLNYDKQSQINSNQLGKKNTILQTIEKRENSPFFIKFRVEALKVLRRIDEKIRS